MGDHWNGDGYGERMTGSETDEVRGRATEEDEFDDVTEDQDQEDDDVDDDLDVDDPSTF
jgi:hypothetical protein